MRLLISFFIALTFLMMGCRDGLSDQYMKKSQDLERQIDSMKTEIFYKDKDINRLKEKQNKYESILFADSVLIYKRDRRILDSLRAEWRGWSGLDQD